MLNKTQETNIYIKEAKLKALYPIYDIQSSLLGDQFWKINSCKINFTKTGLHKVHNISRHKIYYFFYKFCVPSLNNLSGDQDDVTMMEEVLENENNTENGFNSNITGSDLNSAKETTSNYRMFLNC